MVTSPPSLQPTHALFTLIKNYQPNNDTHPLYLIAYLSDSKQNAPYSNFTSGFGRTGIYGGTYRNIDEIIDAFNTTDENSILESGSFITATKKDYKTIIDVRTINSSNPILLYPKGVLQKISDDYNLQPREYWNEQPTPIVPSSSTISFKPSKKSSNNLTLIIIISIIVVLILGIIGFIIFK